MQCYFSSLDFPRQAAFGSGSDSGLGANALVCFKSCVISIQKYSTKQKNTEILICDVFPCDNSCIPSTPLLPSESH